MGFVKFGIVGIGNMGSAHVNFVEAVGNAELTAVCDINAAAFDRIPPEIRKKIKCFTATLIAAVLIYLI